MVSWLGCAGRTSADPAALAFRPHQLITTAGDTVAAELGLLRVPENRRAQPTRTIELAVLRLPSTAARPGDPIVYLAGGPGSSGITTARGSRFPAFRALRAVADVIVLDQRGTGLSRPSLGCSETVGQPLGDPGSWAAEAAAFRAGAERCAARWRGRGVDLAGYQVVEGAADLEALRQALGVPRLALWGMSYGTLLGLTTIRRHPELASAAVLAGVVGPDDSWPLPSLIDRRLGPLDSLEREGLRQLALELDRRPARARIADGTDSVTLAISGFDFRSVMSGVLGDPDRLEEAPALLAAAQRGQLDAVAREVLVDRRPGPIGAAITHLTLCGSGMSSERRARIAREREHSILAPTPNISAEQCEVWGVPELEPAFREPIRSGVPTLLISGTLDLTTPIDHAEAVLAGLSRGHHLIVAGARHGDDLLFAAPEILPIMADFFRGRSPPDRIVHLQARR